MIPPKKEIVLRCVLERRQVLFFIGADQVTQFQFRTAENLHTNNFKNPHIVKYHDRTELVKSILIP